MVFVDSEVTNWKWPIEKPPSSECLLFRGDEMDIIVNEKVNLILRTHLFRGDELDMID